MPPLRTATVDATGQGTAMCLVVADADHKPPGRWTSQGWHAKDGKPTPAGFDLPGSVYFMLEETMKDLVKYPRTFHLPWSDSNSSDDVWWTDCTHFTGKQVVITEKLDGECTSMYRDHYHARSMDSGPHPSRDWAKRLHGTIRHEIPDGWRVCGENCYAYHSIFYHLPTYFFVFGIYDDKNQCLSWDETLQWCELLGLMTVPVRYRGLWDEALCRNSWDGQGAFPTFACSDEYPKWPTNFVPTSAEGYVVRLEDGFHYDDFRRSAAKYVRKNHVQTSSNWMTKPVVPNLLV